MFIKIFVKIRYNMLYLLKIAIKNGGVIIKGIKYKRKKWLDHRSKKIQIRMQKQNNKKCISGVIRYSSKNNTQIFTAPSVFSFINNAEETMGFFEEVLKDATRHIFDRRYFFDLSKVETLTIDAVIYMISILRNLKSNNVFRYKFEGNAPLKEEPNKLLLESGFFAFVNSSVKNIISNSSKIQILNGKDCNRKIARETCDFVNNICNTNLKFTIPLYETLIELMDNTTQHAYKDINVLMSNEWYMFVEDKKETIEFIFIDTGEGIPATINKKFIEILVPNFLVDKRESEYVLSTLNGEFRTRTKLKNRGKGLPWIYQYALEEKIKNLRIYSGHGCCHVVNNKDIKLIDFKNELNGTLFYWGIDKIVNRMEEIE